MKNISLPPYFISDVYRELELNNVLTKKDMNPMKQDYLPGDSLSEIKNADYVFSHIFPLKGEYGLKMLIKAMISLQHIELAEKLLQTVKHFNCGFESVLSRFLN